MRAPAFKAKTVPAFLLCGLLIAAAQACTHSYPEAEDPPGGENPRIQVIFRLPGDDFPYDYDLALRDEIGLLLEERGVGEISSSGAGMGSMSITLEVDDKEPASKAVRRIIRERYPGRVFRIE